MMEKVNKKKRSNTVWQGFKKRFERGGSWHSAGTQPQERSGLGFLLLETPFKAWDFG